MSSSPRDALALKARHHVMMTRRKLHAQLFSKRYMPVVIISRVASLGLYASERTRQLRLLHSRLLQVTYRLDTTLLRTCGDWIEAEATLTTYRNVDEQT